MAARLGATFIEAAMAPLREAGTLLGQGRVGDGLAVLTEDRLMPAVRTAIAAAADRADARPERVDKLLPWDELRACILRLGETHTTASDVWKQHAGGLGGLLSGVGDVTAEAETPDPGWYLSKLAGKLLRDKRLAHPLDALAASVTAWQQLIGRCGALIDASGALRLSYRVKHGRRVAIGAALCACAVYFGSAELSRRATHRRIEAALGGADPCGAEGLSTEDLRQANEEQRAVRNARVEACAVARENARHRAACEALATHLEAGKPAPEDEALLGPKAQLFGRVASGSLEAPDLLLTEKDLECGCPDIGARVWALVGMAAGQSAAAWGTAEAVSEPIKALLARPGAGLDPASQQAIADRAEPIAKRAVFQGAADDIARGRALCDLERALHIEQGKWCTALGVALARQRP